MSESAFRDTTFAYIFQQSAQNLRKNKSLYLKMLEKVDGATALGWSMYLGRELVSQPVVTIEIMEESKVNIDGMCPPFFHEDTPDYVIDEWTANAIESLNAFQMADPKKEAVRKQCLKGIVDADKAYKETQKKK